ncbi:MAG: S8 family peptidase, partial [Nanoarchaeota archaeon]
LNVKTEKYLEKADKNEQNNFIVKFKNSIDDSKLSKFDTEKKYNRFNAVKLSGKIKDIESLLNDNSVSYIELDQETSVLDYYYGYSDVVSQNIVKTNALNAWNFTKGNGVKIGILDTGISPHSDLNIAGGNSMVSNNFSDANGHGTAVDGVVSSVLNNYGNAGVVPSASIYAVKIMNGSYGSLSDAISGVEWAIDNNMSIVLMSFGMETYSQIFKEVLDDAYAHNILLIAASGNNGQDNILYPARYSSVVAVGAVDSFNDLTSFSSYGFEQELVADGVNVNTTWLNNQYNMLSGTSLAAPHVAGVAALIKAYNNSLTNNQIRGKLQNDALDLGSSGKDDYYGFGLVQANLYTTNYTLVNLSYFYEIFNISDYGMPNISYRFWLNGTGTTDDTQFMPGYYLANITYQAGNKKSFNYFVNENGTIYSLIDLANLSDDYTIACPTGVDCRHDHIVFKNGLLQVLVIPQPEDASSRVADCVDFQNNNNEDECYGTQSNLNSCSSADSFFDTHCQEANSCQTFGTSLGKHTMPTSTSKHDDVVTFYCYDTGPSYDHNAQALQDYYICSSRQYVCTSSSQYADRCFYTGGTIDIGTVTCSAGTTCDSNADEGNADFGSSGTSIPSSPCNSGQTTSLCNGTISVIVSDSKGVPKSGSYVYNNGLFNGTTDNDGARNIDYKNAVCGNSQSIDVYCSDNATYCGTKSSTIDSNNDYDSLLFSCDICINKTDLSIKTSDVTIKQQGTKYNITALINVEKATSSNVVVDFRGQNLQNQPTINESKIISVSPYVNQNTSVLWDINSTDFVSITVDFTNKIAETDENNNYIKKTTRPLTKAYLDVNTDYSVLSSVYQNFLDDYIDLVSEANAEVKIYVGRKNTNIPKNSEQISDKQRWELRDNLVRFNSKKEGLPYNGIIVRKNNNIYIFGNDIDGEIAALRKLVDNREYYFSKNVNEKVDYISEESLDGIFVFDYLHTDENQPKYRKNDNNFANVVLNVLNSDVSTLSIKRVLTTNDNTSLRLKHINAELSPKFQQFANPQPVVLARGLWSNLFSWEKFGFEIARGEGTNKPRDTWLIEITGGPNTECANCPNYNYNDLIQYYWPALISGVQAYSNKTNITYIGFSNGCRTALSSLELYNSNGKVNAGYYNNGSEWKLTNLSSHPVERFIGVGCPGAFNGSSAFSESFGEHGQNVLDYFINNGQTHITQKDVGLRLQERCGLFEPKCREAAISLQTNENTNISRNLAADYLNFINDLSYIQPGLNVFLPRFMIIYGEHPHGFEEGSDGVTTEEDAFGILTVVNATSEGILKIPGIDHNQLVGNYFTELSIRRNLE